MSTASTFTSSNSMGTPQNVMLEQLAWLGKEVMPSFVAR